MHVLIIPDKFKGTLPAGAAAEAIARGWRQARPADKLRLVPMSDGGDGFGQVLGAQPGVREETLQTIDAAHRPLAARWWWQPATKTAIIESAAVIGLALLPARKFHPFELDTFGLAAVVQAAAARGARRCILGIGGSATNDAGFGLARALGWQFLDRQGRGLERWTDLVHLVRLQRPRRQRWFRELLVAVDVHNPLLGARGATRVYGPQKGLRAADFDLAEGCLRRLARVVRQDLGRDLAREPGAGAAGGLGFGLLAFLNARLESGFELFARQAGLDKQLRSADWVITAEGAIDHSTLMGKGAGQVARRCRQLGLPCIGLAGMVTADGARRKTFAQIHALTELTDLEQAKAQPALWLERLTAQVARGVQGKT
ncbi:MAG TPA: glycerate kinase [Candidatus Sulfotelmatobacter sp.]|nr:glycerate kinase [Candidatus Sulfotelmatobacter sp.]HWI57841.1 glycerate kinase [Bacillota bacterium]